MGAPEKNENLQKPRGVGEGPGFAGPRVHISAPHSLGAARAPSAHSALGTGSPVSPKLFRAGASGPGCSLSLSLSPAGPRPSPRDSPAHRAASDDHDGVGGVPGDRPAVDVVDPGVRGGDPCGARGNGATLSLRPPCPPPRPPVPSAPATQSSPQPGRAWPGRARRRPGPSGCPRRGAGKPPPAPRARFRPGPASPGPPVTR
jgi:hypothetical protein